MKKMFLQFISIKPPVGKFFRNDHFIKERSPDAAQVFGNVDSQQPLQTNTTLICNSSKSPPTIDPKAFQTSLLGCPASSKAACCGATCSWMNFLTTSRNKSCRHRSAFISKAIKAIKSNLLSCEDGSCPNVSEATHLCSCRSHIFLLHNILHGGEILHSGEHFPQQ